MAKKKVSKKKSGAKMRGPKTKVSSKICKEYCSKNKDINVVAPIPINVPLTIPTNLKIIDRLKSIKDKVFSTFGFGPPEIPND